MAIQSFYVFKIKYKVIFKHSVFVCGGFPGYFIAQDRERYWNNTVTMIMLALVHWLQVQMCIYLDLQVSAAASYLYLSFLTHSNQLLCVIDFLGNKYGKWCQCFSCLLTH